MGHRKGILELSHKSKQVYLAEKILGRSVDKWLGMLNRFGEDEGRLSVPSYPAHSDLRPGWPLVALLAWAGPPQSDSAP